MEIGPATGPWSVGGMIQHTCVGHDDSQLQHNLQTVDVNDDINKLSSGEQAKVVAAGSVYETVIYISDSAP